MTEDVRDAKEQVRIACFRVNRELKNGAYTLKLRESEQIRIVRDALAALTPADLIGLLKEKAPHLAVTVRQPTTVQHLSPEQQHEWEQMLTIGEQEARDR